MCVDIRVVAVTLRVLTDVGEAGTITREVLAAPRV